MKLVPTLAVAAIFCASLYSLTACDEKKQAPQTQPTTTTSNTSGVDEHGHVHAPGEEHHESTAGHGGPVIQLGRSTIGPFDVNATRDDGQIIAGKDAAFDVTVTTTAGSTAKANAVRFWIGTEDGKGSIKSRADIENPAEPNRWHTHAEIPNPIPAGCKLWIEIEDDAGNKSVGSFDLMM